MSRERRVDGNGRGNGNPTARLVIGDRSGVCFQFLTAPWFGGWQVTCFAQWNVRNWHRQALLALPSGPLVTHHGKDRSCVASQKGGGPGECDLWGPSSPEILLCF